MKLRPKRAIFWRAYPGTSPRKTLFVFKKLLYILTHILLYKLSPETGDNLKMTLIKSKRSCAAAKKEANNDRLDNLIIHLIRLCQKLPWFSDIDPTPGRNIG